ncbi:MAG: sulfatase [Actinomycetota bacterium]
MRRRVAALSVLGLLAGAVMFFATGSLSGPATATPPTAPNIVLILSDDQSLDALAAMPFLTSKPGGGWIEFTNAFLNTPLCCPTRATLLSGLYPHHHGVTQNTGGPFDHDSTLATWLQSAGYRTGLAGKYLNDYPFGSSPFVPPGWSDWFANVGTSKYYNYDMFDNGTTVSYGSAPEDYHTDVIARRADAFIRSSAGEPFFLYASPIAPHSPTTPPERYAKTPFTVTRSPNFNEADVSDKPAWIQSLPLLSPNLENAMDKKRVQQYRAVQAVDDLIRTVYDALDDTNTLDNTVIVFMTDNGYLFGEHRGSGKNCVYEECIRTPMYVRVPWIEERVEPGLVSSVDIAPTFADLAGMVPPDAIDGTSFLPLIEDPGAGWRSSLLHQTSGTNNQPGFWAIRTHEWKYAELSTGERELYDLINDPYELENRAGQAELADLQAQLAAELEALRTAPPSGGDPSPSPSPSSSETPSPSPSPSPTATCKRVCEPSPSPSPSPTESPSPSPSPTDCRRFC